MFTLTSEYEKLYLVKSAIVRRFFKKDKVFSGDAHTICSAIIEQSWNGSFYRTGQGHFDMFWMRDFGGVCEALVAHGGRDRVLATVRWTLDQYRTNGHVALCLSQSGNAFDQPTPSIDALPYLLMSIRTSTYPLSPEERLFLENEIRHYCESFIDPNTGLLREYMNVSELRDTTKYRRSAYAVTMLALMHRESLSLGLPLHPSLKHDYVQLLLRDYWNGSYFDADLGVRAWSTEANLFPLWLGLIEDRAIVDAVCDTIRTKGLTKPCPIRYTDTPHTFHYFGWARMFLPNYAGTTLWTWLGAVYLQILQRAERPEFEEEYRTFTAMIERCRNFPELLDSDGRWYQTPFYRAEEGMIWAVLYLDIHRQAGDTTSRESVSQEKR